MSKKSFIRNELGYIIYNKLVIINLQLTLEGK